MLRRFLVLAILACGVCRGQTIADFDKVRIEPAPPVITIEPGEGNFDSFLRFRAPGQSSKLINLPLPQGMSLDGVGVLSAEFRAGAKPDDLRWFGIDDKRRVIFQRKFTLPAGETFERVSFPLNEWRWGNEYTGSWKDVRTLILRAESADPDFDLDDVELKPADAKEDRSMVTLAFGDAARVLAKDGLLVATDAVTEISEAQQQAMLDRMETARRLIQRVAGEGYRPTQQPQPACLLIFRDPAGDDAFFQRLGERWRAQIVPPTQGGYTVQSIATSVWDPAKGPDRPVYLHEAVHAIAARELRLLPGTPGHGPLQEGLANYVQLIVYPKSLGLGVYAEHFGKPIKPGTMFIPLSALVKGSPKTAHYAQLASLVAYLIENEPQTLVTWVRSVSDGIPLDEALKAKNDSIDQLQERWWAWGVERFVGKEVETHFPTPQEYR